MRRMEVVQMSEAFPTVAFLALSGGLQDAYSYLARGQVFANAQTGNIVLLGGRLVAGDLLGALRYLAPLAAFACGVCAAAAARTGLQKARLHWRQVVVLGEIVLLVVVAFLPAGLDVLANALVSFSCAMQVQAFRKVDGCPYASTMCIGNLRSGVDLLAGWRRTGDRQLRARAARYFAVIALFALGAGGGALAVARFGHLAILGSCGLLLAGFALMFVRRRFWAKTAVQSAVLASIPEPAHIAPSIDAYAWPVL